MTIKEFWERVEYDGYLEQDAGGGGSGKSGGGATVAPPPLPVSTIGNTLDDVVQKTATEEDVTLDSVDKKKLGTRGLQIPLASPASTTNTAAGSGVQV